MSRRLILTCIMSLILAACGGDSDKDAPFSDRSTKPKADPRAGFLAEAEIEEFTSTVETYAQASDRYYDTAAACKAEADRLLKSGKTPRQSVACQLRLTDGVITNVQRLRDVLDGLDGDYRKACDEQLVAFTSVLDRFDATLTTLRTDWVDYGAGRPIPKLNAHATAVDNSAQQLSDAVPSLAAECFTEADRAKAESQLAG